jgi:hypothetical protein
LSEPSTPGLAAGNTVAARLGDDPVARILLPVGRSGRAIAAGYLGLVSVLLVPAPFALLAGVLAVRDIRRDAAQHGLGRAWFGILMGLAGTVGLILMMVAIRRP